MHKTSFALEGGKILHDDGEVLLETVREYFVLAREQDDLDKLTKLFIGNSHLHGIDDHDSLFGHVDQKLPGLLEIENALKFTQRFLGSVKFVGCVTMVSANLPNFEFRQQWIVCSEGEKVRVLYFKVRANEEQISGHDLAQKILAQF